MITINLMDDIWEKQFKKRWQRLEAEADQYAQDKLIKQIKNDVPIFLIGVGFGILLGMMIIIWISYRHTGV